MTRILLYIFMASALSAWSPCRAEAGVASEMSESTDADRVAISISESVLRVSGAAGMTMAIYSIAGGAPVMKVKIDSPDRRFDLSLPRGIYIVQVGKSVRKIVIK